MEPVTLEELKLWCRVDADDFDAELATLGVAAREYVERATGRTYVGEEAEPIPELGKVAIKALAGHWFDNREPVSSGTASSVPFHVRAMIHQLTDWTLIEARQEAEAES